MAILWMVPIYGLTSWISLVKPQLEPFLGTVRDIYEAYVIYTFFGLLIAIIDERENLGLLIDKLSDYIVEERHAIIQYDELMAIVSARKLENSPVPDDTVLPKRRPKEHISPPCPCCYKYQNPKMVAKAWLYQCKFMAMQFVFMKPLLAIVPYILAISHLVDINNYSLFVGEAINWKSPRVYLLLAENLSVALAFYALLSLYHGLEKEISWCDPWPKFLCIKGVVFATFWQNVTIQIMNSFGLVDQKASVQIQNLLICIEMLLASLAHVYVFPYQEWAEGYKKEKNQGIRLNDTFALKDFLSDLKLMVTTWEQDKSQEGSVILSHLNSRDESDLPQHNELSL